jgi:Ca2+-binding RTX toxin-like protein
MLGFDWVTHRGDPQAGDADLFFTGLQPPDEENVRDRFDDVEGLSGWQLNDTLRGDDANNAVGGVVGHQLTNIALIDGLQDVLGAGVTSYNSGNIILGGDGNDLIEGRGGDDIIDGDRWLNVRLQATDVNNNVISADSMTQLQAAAFAGQINPGSIRVVREILTADGAGDIDTAVFSGARANYTISAPDSQRRIIITDTVGTDGSDTVRNVERLQFADQVVVIAGNSAPVGVPTINDTSPTEGQALTASTAGITDGDGTTGATFTFQWQRSTDGITWAAIAGATAAVYTPVQADVNQRLRVQVTFTDDSGTVETATSAATGGVGDLINGDAAANTINGTAFDDTINGLGGNDVLNGVAGADVLSGGAGIDVLNGGVGADRMAGGASSDTYVVDDPGDVVTEAAAQGTDTVQTTLSSYTLGANVENLTFTGAGNFTGNGNGLANTITGGSGADTLNGGGGVDTLNGGVGNDVLNGGVGADQMVGGPGNDTYVVDTASDVVTEAAGQGTDTVQTTLSSYTLGANVENLTFTGAGNFTGNGNGLANAITGGSGADTLNGVAGADRLTGGAGNDSLNGGVDNDTFVFATGFGRDTIAAGFDANPTGGQDLLNIAALGITSATFANSVTITDVGANTLIGIGGASITLVGVGNATTITQADFILAQ